MLIKIRFSEGISDFTYKEKTALSGLKLEKTDSDSLLKYKFETDNVSEVFSMITSLGYRNKLILGSSKSEGKFCIMELSK